MKTKTIKLLALSLSLTLTSCASLFNPFLPDIGDLSSSQTSQTSQSSSSSSKPSTSSSSYKVDESDPYVSVAKERNISELVALGNKKDTTNLYKITGVVQYISSPNYGNFDIIDETGDIFVYGCTATYSSIKKSGSTYSYTNNKSFKTSGVKQGDTVTLIGMYTYYTYSGSDYGYPEFMGYVYSIDEKTDYTLEASTYDKSLEDYSGNYYSSIGDVKGKELGKQLHNLMDTTHTNYTSYSSLYNHWKNTGEASGNSYKCIYSGKMTSSANREHVWPQSHSNGLWGQSYGGADILHLRPAVSSYNSARSNAPFGEILGDNVKPRSISYSGGGASRYATKVFEPADAVKGDIARIIMYVYVHYSTDFGGNTKSYYADLSLGDVLAPYYDDQCFKLLRKWNALDPVSEQEKTLNNYVQTVQGNRNPFIDHPSYADLIFGNMWLRNNILSF